MRVVPSQAAFASGRISLWVFPPPCILVGMYHFVEDHQLASFTALPHSCE